MFDRETVSLAVCSQPDPLAGYGIVALTTSEEVDRAIKELSGSKLLGTNISIRSAQESEKFPARLPPSKTRDPNASLDTENEKFKMKKGMTKYWNERDEQEEKDKMLQDYEMLQEIHNVLQSPIPKIAPNMNWNAVNSIKIRTSLGSGSGKDTSKDTGRIDKPKTASADLKTPPGLSEGNHTAVAQNHTQAMDLASIRKTFSQTGNDDTETEDVVMLINLENGREDGTENEANAGENSADSDIESENESYKRSESQAEGDEASINHQITEQLAVGETTHSQQPIPFPSTQNARILAELSPEDLNAQLRYFHITKDRGGVDQNTPVRCLVCSKQGHMAGACELLTCAGCGAHNQHTTQSCPNSARCKKCREQGHDQSHCPYKLKKLAYHEIICDLCNRNGHTEENCELNWRTSGRPWESDLTRGNVRLSCYECGGSGHLGNDCPTRRPGKSMGTSSWSNSLGHLSIKSQAEICIKGRGNRQQPINLDDSDDERANFYRPRISVPQPVRRGRIKIVTGRRTPPRYASGNDGQVFATHRPGSFTPINEPYRGENVPQPQYPEYRDDSYGNWRARVTTDPTSGNGSLHDKDYRPSSRRSASPPYQDRNNYGHSDRLQPSLPQASFADRHVPTRADNYRPMPSAAQNAWSRHRM